MDLKEMVLSALSDLQAQETARRAHQKPLPPEEPACDLAPLPQHAPVSLTEPPVSERSKPALSSNTEAEKPLGQSDQMPPPANEDPPVHESALATQAPNSDQGDALIALSTALEAIKKEERLFLGDLKERLLVLFEGLQSPNNKQIEAKVDLVLNFFEYLLATTEERLESLDHG